MATGIVPRRRDSFQSPSGHGLTRGPRDCRDARSQGIGRVAVASVFSGARAKCPPTCRELRPVAFSSRATFVPSKRRENEARELDPTYPMIISRIRASRRCLILSVSILLGTMSTVLHARRTWMRGRQPVGEKRPSDPQEQRPLCDLDGGRAR
jgi:hypothetical protein